MKLQEQSREIEKNAPVLERMECQIKSSPQAFDILSRMYEDPILACIRELCANAIDSHIDAGVRDKPIQVTLPSIMNNFQFKVRDFGTSMTPEKIRDVYVNYMSSDKTRTNEQTGCFGLGSKTPWAYTSTFNVTTFLDGTKRIYVGIKNAENRPEFNLIYEGETEEDNGVEVSFAARKEDCTLFNQKARQVFQHFEVEPVVYGVDNFRIERYKPLYEGKDWKLFKSSNKFGAWAVMGNIAYPIASSNLRKEGDATIRWSYETKYDNICRSGFSVECKLGELNITPAREALEYTDKTINAIRAKIDTMIDELSKKAYKNISQAKTYWEACVKYKELKGEAGNLISLLSDIESPKWKGKEVESSMIHHRIPNVTQLNWESSWKSKTTGKTLTKSYNTKYVYVGSKYHFLILDVKTGHHKRIEQAYKDGKLTDIVLLVPEDEVDNFCDKVGITKPEFERVSSYDKPTVAVTTKAGTTVRKNYKRNTIPVWTYKNDGSGTRSQYNNWCGQYWSDERVLTDDGPTLYVQVHNYSITVATKPHITASHLNNIYSVLKAANIDIPPVYGIKKAQQERVDKLKNWELFGDWLKRQLKAFLSKKDIQDRLNLEEEYNKLSNNMVKGYIKIGEKLNGSSAGKTYDQFYQRLVECKEGFIGYSALSGLARQFSLATPPKPNPSDKLVQLEKKMLAKYGDLFDVVDSWKLQYDTYIDFAAKHISLVDKTS